MNTETNRTASLKKQGWKIRPGSEARARFTKIAERLDMPVATLAAMAITELSFIRPEAFFKALGTIPDEMKARPVGRPAGSTAAHKEARTAAVA